MTLLDLIKCMPESKYNYNITAKAYYNDNMESQPIQGAYLDDENKELVIKW